MQAWVLEGGGWSASCPGRFTPGKDPVPIVQEAGWAPGPVWTGVENFTLIGIRFPDRPSRGGLSNCDSTLEFSWMNGETTPYH